MNTHQSVKETTTQLLAQLGICSCFNHAHRRIRISQSRPFWKLPLHNRCSHVAFAEDSKKEDLSNDWSTDSALKSLDQLLGSMDEAPSVPLGSVISQKRKLQSNDWVDLSRLGIHKPDAIFDVPKVLPIWSFIFYYWHIVIFCAGLYLDASEGPGAGDDFMNQLVNDHLAVAQGHEVLRLVTAPFVHDDPWSLFVTLLALGLLGQELEGVMGYWSFGMMSLLLGTISSAAEAAADTYPVTHGSLPLIGGLVGASLILGVNGAMMETQVSEARNKQQRTAASSTSTTTGSSSSDSLEYQKDVSVLMHGDEPGTARQVQQSPLGQQDSAKVGGNKQKDSEAEAEAEVEFMEGLFTVNMPASQLARSFVLISTGVVATTEAFYDLQQDGDMSSSWSGIVVGVLAGLALGLGTVPRYRVQRMKLQDAYLQSTQASDVANFPVIGPLVRPLSQKLDGLGSGDTSASGTAWLEDVDNVDVLYMYDVIPAWKRFVFLGMSTLLVSYAACTVANVL